MVGVRRAGQILVNAVTGVSLVLCVGVVVLWGMSYRAEGGGQAVVRHWGHRLHPNYTKYYDAWEFDGINARGRCSAVFLLRGCASGPGRYEATPGARGLRLEFGKIERNRQSLVEHFLEPQQSAGEMAGVRYAWQARWCGVSVPHPLMAGVLAVLPVWAGVRRRLRLRGRREGGVICAECGYDLRATPGRCPECGMVPARMGWSDLHGHRR